MNNLQKLRIKAGLTQQKLADMMGYNVQMIRSYEQGTRDINIMKFNNMIKLCQILKCYPSELVTDKELKESLKKIEN